MELSTRPSFLQRRLPYMLMLQGLLSGNDRVLLPDHSE